MFEVLRMWCDSERNSKENKRDNKGKFSRIVQIDYFSDKKDHVVKINVWYSSILKIYLKNRGGKPLACPSLNSNSEDWLKVKLQMIFSTFLANNKEFGIGWQISLYCK